MVAHDDGGVLGEDAVGVLLVGREGGHAEAGAPQSVDVGPVLVAGLGQVDLSRETLCDLGHAVGDSADDGVGELASELHGEVGL